MRSGAHGLLLPCFLQEIELDNQTIAIHGFEQAWSKHLLNSREIRETRYT